MYRRRCIAHPPQPVLPILDMQMFMDVNNKIQYKFFKKPMCNRFTMMAHSAVSDRVKRSSMTNEAMRRLLCCSPGLGEEHTVEVMEEFARMLKRSGYTERFRHEVISDAIRGHQKLVQGEEAGGRPVDRPRTYQQEERRRRRQEKGERWFRKEERSTRVREGVFIIPPTPGSILAKAFKKICQEELKGSNIQMSVTERGGRRLGDELGVTVPGASSKEACMRQKCFPCNSGQGGVCRRTGVGYQIVCLVCKQTNITSNYEGESGRNLFRRGQEYVQDVDKKRENKPLWKHIVEKHGGVMELPMFQQFSMMLTKVFRKPQRRKADEGVRIAHLDPETRMNSKDEFRQGTNIFVRPMRGVGM